MAVEAILSKGSIHWSEAMNLDTQSALYWVIVLTCKEKMQTISLMQIWPQA